MMLSLIVAAVLFFIFSNWKNIKHKISNVQEMIGGGQIKGTNLSESTENTGFTNNWLNERDNDKLFKESYPDFEMYQESKTEDTNYKTILSTIQNRSPVSDMFFSLKNIQNLKDLIAKEVHLKANYSITPSAQSTTELLVIMRSIFLQYAKHLECNIEQQVAELNYKILQEVVPRIISKIGMELTYQRDRSSQPLPNQLPVNVNITGTNSNIGFSGLIP